MGFQICQDEAADKVLDDSAFALLAGMMLDQQYPMDNASHFADRTTAN